MNAFVRSLKMMTAGILASASVVIHASAADALVVQAGSPVPTPAYLDTYIAQQAGFFKQEGVEVEMRYTQGAALATQLAASGNADIADVTFEPYLLGYKQGLRGKFVYNRYDELIYWIAVPVDSPIKTASDLKGATIGVASMASSSLTVARSILRNSGIDPASQQFLPVGTGDQAIAALSSGQVQALSLWDGVYGSLERAGHQFRYIEHPTVGSAGNGGFFVSDAVLESKRSQIESYLRAIVKARIFARENPDAALAIYWQTNPAARPAGDATEAREKGLQEIKFKAAIFNNAPVEAFGIFDLQKVGAYMDVLKTEGVFTADLTPSDLVTNDLIVGASKIDPTPVQKMAQEWGK